MTRAKLLMGIATIALALALLFSLPRAGDAQTKDEPLPHPKLEIVSRPTYTPVGVATLAATGAVAAYMIATPATGDPYPVMCATIRNNVDCYKGAFPK
jgi:hypothetical protein